MALRCHYVSFAEKPLCRSGIFCLVIFCYKGYRCSAAKFCQPLQSFQSSQLSLFFNQSTSELLVVFRCHHTSFVEKPLCRSGIFCLVIFLLQRLSLLCSLILLNHYIHFNHLNFLYSLINQHLNCLWHSAVIILLSLKNHCAAAILFLYHFCYNGYRCSAAKFCSILQHIKSTRITVFYTFSSCSSAGMVFRIIIMSSLKL